MKPARIARAFVRSTLATAAILGVFALLAGALALGMWIATGDKLESAGEMLSGAPGFLAKLVLPFVLTWAVIFFNALKRENANEH
ncbi:hypothetical protein K1X12_00910 [Hyphomonas sp. WL0036]|uniref:hypothetical protein n=1 Tax=Hyphomonas sediminis TaxID=2866160 RepID=UPI001C7F949F|nr:hypothetical protein [Hyphomonas sediminis]MBY9065436.1 hypothetical protein [Hyphomonas sediminis]